MSLEKIYQVWHASWEADMLVDNVRRYNKTHDKFNLSAYSEVIVFLALYISSQTTTTMLKDHCDPDEYEEGGNMPNIVKYQPMIDVFEEAGQLLDVMNGC